MVTKTTSKAMPKNNYLRDLITSWVIVFIFGLFIGSAISFGVFALCKDDEHLEEVIVDEYLMQLPTYEAEPMALSFIVPTEPIEEPVEVVAVVEDEKEYLGNFRITAYCSCKKCCGKWADNRPNGIVYGASGAELKAGVSVASPLPFGTEVYIDGLGDYVVQDRLANWVVEKYGENLIDVYFDSHEDAWNFGCKYLDVFKVVK